jgi:hypothetical protein
MEAKKNAMDVCQVHVMSAITLGLYAVLAYGRANHQSEGRQRILMHAIVWNLFWDGIVAVWGVGCLGGVIALSVVGLPWMVLAVLGAVLPAVPALANVAISVSVVGQYRDALRYPYPWPCDGAVRWLTEKLELVVLGGRPGGQTRKTTRDEETRDAP